MAQSRVFWGYDSHSCVLASLSVTFFGSVSLCGSLARFFPSFPLIPAQALTFKASLCRRLSPSPIFLSTPQSLALTLRPETLSSSRRCCFLQALVLPTPRPYVRADGAVAPDHWLDPSAVWEVKCADLSLSPIYPAARGLVSRGTAGLQAVGGTRGPPSKWEMGSRGSWSPCLCSGLIVTGKA